MCTKKSVTDLTLEKLEKISGEKLTLGVLLYAIRQGEEMTQAAFAKRLGVSKQYLCDIEHSRRSVSPKKAEKFALALGYSTQQFVRLCLQDLIDREGIPLIVSVKAA